MNKLDQVLITGAAGWLGLNLVDVLTNGIPGHSNVLRFPQAEDPLPLVARSGREGIVGDQSDVEIVRKRLFQ